MQSADLSKVICRNCEFRLKMLFQVNARTIDEGNTGSWCGVYTEEISSGKPHDILFRNSKYKYYLEDENLSHRKKAIAESIEHA